MENSRRRRKSFLLKILQDRPYFGTNPVVLYNAAKNSKYLFQRFRCQNSLKSHSGCVNTISWDSTGRYILSGSDDLHLSITDAFTGEIRTKIRTGHITNIFSAKYLPNTDDVKVISCSGDGVVIYTDLNCPETAYKNIFDCQHESVYDIVTVPNDPNTFLTCSQNKTVRWYDLRVKHSCQKHVPPADRYQCMDDVLIQCDYPVTAIAINHSLPWQLAVGCSDAIIRIYDRRMLTTKTLGKTLTKQQQNSSIVAKFTYDGMKDPNRITSLAYNRNCEQLLASYSNDYIYLFNLYDVKKTIEFGKEEDILSEKPNKRQQPPYKRFRLRGDWSDTGPNALSSQDEFRNFTRNYNNNTNTNNRSHSPNNSTNTNNSQQSNTNNSSINNSSSSNSSNSSDSPLPSIRSSNNSERLRQLNGILNMLFRSTYPVNNNNNTNNNNEDNQSSTSMQTNHNQSSTSNASSTNSTSSTSSSTTNTTAQQQQPQTSSSSSSNRTREQSSSSNNNNNNDLDNPSDSLGFFMIFDDDVDYSSMNRSNNNNDSDDDNDDNDDEHDEDHDDDDGDDEELSDFNIGGIIINDEDDDDNIGGTDDLDDNNDDFNNVFDLDYPMTPTTSNNNNDNNINTSSPGGSKQQQRQRSRSSSSNESNLIQRRHQRLRSQQQEQQKKDLLAMKQKQRQEKKDKRLKIYKIKNFKKFTGHRNSRTVIKEATFWGDDYIISGSDCGHIFFWSIETGEIVMVLQGDQHVVNCLQPHPTDPILASSGIDYDIKIWGADSEDSLFNPKYVQKLTSNNRNLLEESRDTVTVPARFVLSLFTSMQQRQHRNAMQLRQLYRERSIFGGGGGSSNASAAAAAATDNDSSSTRSDDGSYTSPRRDFEEEIL